MYIFNSFLARTINITYLIIIIFCMYAMLGMHNLSFTIYTVCEKHVYSTLA